MANRSVIHIVCVGYHPATSGELVTRLRDVGLMGELHGVEDAEALRDACSSTDRGVILHLLDNPAQISLAEAIACAHGNEPALPVIALGEDRGSAGETLAAGANDLVEMDDALHLSRVIIREIANLERAHALRHLRGAHLESEQRANTLMKSSRDAIAYLHDGMHVMANQAYLQRFGYSNFDELAPISIMDLVDPSDHDKVRTFLRIDSATEPEQSMVELQLRQADSSAFRAQLEFCPASVEGEACQQIIIRDSTSTEALEAQLRELARRDPVTHLYNQQHFLTLLEQAVMQAERKREKSAILQLQVVDFPFVRQKVGVKNADQILTDIAALMQSITSDNDQLARFEGANFALLTREAAPERLESTARRIRKAIREHIFEAGAASINLSVCIGICVVDRTVNDTNDASHRSEQALEQALKKGSDVHRIYEPRPGELSQKQIDEQWIDRIRQLLRNERFLLQFQPIVSVRGDTTERYRVQLHVLGDDGSMNRVPELLAAANRTGMSRGIDRWMVLNALKVLMQHLKKGRKAVFFIPLSEHAFDDSDLIRWIHQRVKSLKLPKGSVVFETSAAGAASRLKRASAFAGAMHDLGYEFCLDDFGHGRDPFQLTQHVNVDYLRLHEIFVHDIVRNRENQQAVRELAKGAHAADIRTISPGVSNAAALSTIWTLGTDLVEGDFLQKPTREPDYDFSSMAG